MLNHLGRAALIVAKAVSYKFLGKEPTEDFIQLIRELREPSQTLVPDQPSDAAARAAGEAGVESPVDLQAAIEITLDYTAAKLPLQVLTDSTVDPPKAGQMILDAVGDELPREGFYLLWLEPPLTERPCYVHFYWQWQEDRKVTAYTVRDFYHKRMYYGKRASSPALENWWVSAAEWKESPALDIWNAARQRIRCRGLFAHAASQRQEWEKWRATLKEMTDSEWR
jgi:hypothetical protein